MTKREKFINFIDKEIFENETIYTENYPTDWNDIVSFWENFKSDKNKDSSEMTENGIKLIAWMQENADRASTAKEIGEALSISGRSVAGSMKKLIKDEYVEKIETKPIQYALTNKGKTYKVEN